MGDDVGCYGNPEQQQLVWTGAGTSGVLRWVPDEASRDLKDEQDQPAEREETQTYDTVGKS